MKTYIIFTFACSLSFVFGAFWAGTKRDKEEVKNEI